MAKDTFYFSHDYNARNDEKIKRLIRVHGMLGYGIFWAIVEDLYNNANALQTDYDGIAYELRTAPETVKSIVEDFELFVIEGGCFGSGSIEKRLSERNEKSNKAKKSAFQRWNKDANALRTQSDGNAIKERKGKERKGNYTLLTGSEHFLRLKEIFSLPYQSQNETFRTEHTQKEYEQFQKFLQALHRDFSMEQLTANFDKCLTISDWKKHLMASSYMILKPAIEKTLAAKEGNREQMALRIKTFTNGLFDQKVFVK